MISLSSNGYAGRLVTTERPWAESMKAYPAMRSPFMLFMVACERRSGVAQETAWLSPGILSKDEVAAQAAI